MAKSKSAAKKKILTAFAAAVVLIFIGGFAWIALTDVPVRQQDVTKDISVDSLNSNNNNAP